LAKVKFDSRISSFFSNYLVDRKISYLWNNFSSPSFNISVGVGQSSTFFPILSALYLSSILHIFEKRLKNLKIPVVLIFFVDDRLFVSQNTSLAISNSQLFYSYHIMSSLLRQFGLIIKHGKIEVFYFTRSHSYFNPLSLNLTALGRPILYPKKT